MTADEHFKIDGLDNSIKELRRRYRTWILTELPCSADDLEMRRRNFYDYAALAALDLADAISRHAEEQK